MRFVVAAIAAFLVLMLDFDALPNKARSDLSTSSSAFRVSDSASETAPATVSLLESASASEDSGGASEPPKPETEASQAPSEDEFCRALKEAAEAADIPLPFFARLIWRESEFHFNEVSNAGAQGVAQFMPETAAEVGLDDPFDPLKALPASAQLLRRLREEFGNLGLAAAAYNAGSGRIQKWLAKETGLPRETRDYVRIITGTTAESWADEARTASMRLDLPSDATCEGVGGLSKAKDVAQVSVSLAPAVSAVVKKAEAAEAAAKLAASRERKRMALALKSRKARAASGARSSKLRTALAAHSSRRG